MSLLGGNLPIGLDVVNDTALEGFECLEIRIGYRSREAFQSRVVAISHRSAIVIDVVNVLVDLVLGDVRFEDYYVFARHCKLETVWNGRVDGGNLYNGRGRGYGIHSLI